MNQGTPLENAYAVFDSIDRGTAEMATETVSEPSPLGTDSRPIELAPSELAAPEPSFARGVGVVGGVLAVFGLSVIVVTDLYGSPRIVSKSWGFVTLALGMVAMIFHAIRDSDLQIRRVYAVVGFGFIALCGLISLVRHELFLVYGWACLLAGLFFLMPFLRHETDVQWRKASLTLVGALGAFFTGMGFLFGITVSEFILTYGLIFSLLGLFYLLAYIGQVGSDEGPGHHAAQAIVAVGAFASLYAVIWSMIRGRLGIEGYFFVPTGLMLLSLGMIYLVVGLGILSDNRLVVLTRRELTAFFCSPIAYVVLVGMALMCWLNFWSFVGRLAMQPVFEPILNHYFVSLFFVLALIFAVPAVTMRLLSEEKHSGTYEVLMSAPVHEMSVVLSKFFAGFIFFMLLWIPLGLYLIGLRVEFGRPFDYRPLLSFYVAAAFSSAGYVAMGLFFSSLTRNQIVAAILTFLGMLVPLFSEVPPELIGTLWQGFFDRISYIRLWSDAMKGLLAVRDLVLHASIAVFWLFLTVKTLEVRKWN